VVRGGFGVFYDRVNENLTMTAERLNGINQQQYLVTGLIGLDTFSVPPYTDPAQIVALCSFDCGARGFLHPPSRSINWPTICARPYTMQSVVSVEPPIAAQFGRSRSATSMPGRSMC